MGRITKTNLIAEIEDVNKLLKESGSQYSYKYQHRNGYHAVDLMKVDQCVRCLDCGEPPVILIDKLLNDYDFYLGGE